MSERGLTAAEVIAALSQYPPHHEVLVQVPIMDRRGSVGGTALREAVKITPYWNGGNPPGDPHGGAITFRSAY